MIKDPVHALIAVLVVLECKHFICDYPLQSLYQLRNKGTYFHPGGLLHAGLHAIATSLAFLVVPPSVGLGIAIVVGEFLLHYHIDWGKEQLVRRRAWNPAQNQFWWTMGADQLLHHLTYIGIAALLVGAA